MIDYNPKSWLSILIHSYSRHVMRSLMPVLLFMTIYSAAICYVILTVLKLQEKDFHSTIGMHSLLGIVLGLFLVFRTNSAYDRWWEGRKLWGGLVNSTRNMALKLNAYLPPDDVENREFFCKTITNFVSATKEHLRKGVNLNELEPTGKDFLEKLRGVKHIPNRISASLYERTNMLYSKEKLSGFQFLALDKEMKDFIDLMGACERIKNTPIPYSYSMYIKKFVFIYIISLPFGFVTQTEYVTIPIVVLISYVITSVELIAEEIEDPFGRDINDLPTDTLTNRIGENMKEILLSNQSASKV